MCYSSSLGKVKDREQRQIEGRRPTMAPPTKAKQVRPTEGHASRSSSRSTSQRNSEVSLASVSLDRMDVDEQKKRKRENEGKDEKSNLARMRAISAKLRDFLHADENTVSLKVCKRVLDSVCDMEDLLIEILLENERLGGIIEAGHASGVSGEREKEASYASISARHAGPTSGARMQERTNVNASASEKHAVVVRSNDEQMTSMKIKEKVLKDIQPNLQVRVNAVRMLRSGGIAIEAASEKELTQIKSCGLFDKAGLTVAAPKKIGPKVIMYDVPREMATKDLMSGMYEKNLKDVLSENEMKQGATLVSRGGKKDSVVENVIVELPGKAWRHLVNVGRVYVGWYAFKVRAFEVVPQCFGCYGFGHRLKECKEGSRLCKKCGQAGHVQNACKSDRESCRNCKVRKQDSNHSVMSTECPEYVRALERMRSTVHYG